MDNFLNSLSQQVGKVLQPVEQVGQSAINSVQQGFNNFLTGQAQQHQNQPDLYNQLSQEFSKFVPQNLPIGLNTQPSPLSSILSYEPSFLQQNIQQPVTNLINNKLSGFPANVAKDITNIGTGLLSLPGVAAQAGQSPQQAISVGNNLINGLVNSYKSDIGFDNQGNWSLQNVGNNLYNRPVSTLLDVLPVVGALGKLGTLGKAGETAADLGNIDKTKSFAEIQQAHQQSTGLTALSDFENATRTGDKAGMQDALTQIMNAPDDSPLAPYKVSMSNIAQRMGVTNDTSQVADALNYPSKMRDRGFSQDQIDQVSAPIAQDMLSHKITPDNFAEYMQGKNGLSGYARNIFINWTNSRAASGVEGMVQKKNFSQYDSEGLQGILDFQKDPSSYQDVKDYFDNKYADLQNAGVKVNYKQNYLPQLWQDSPEKVTEILGKTLNPNTAKFTMQSILTNYAEGISHGLTPRFNNLSDLVGWYEQSANKLLADNEFYNSLKQEGYLSSGHKAGNVNIVNTNYSATPEVAKVINNYLSTPDDALSKLANVTSMTKNVILGSGLPNINGYFGGWNFHGITTLARQTLFSDNPISGFFKGVSYLTRPRLAQQFIDNNLKDASVAIHDGLNLNIEDHQFIDNALENANIIQKGYDWQQKIFADALFKQVLPALKLEKYNWLKSQLTDSLGEEQAGREAATISNNIFGGQNLDALMRSKVTQNLLRSIIFAPDHVESYLKQGGNAVKSLANPLDPALQPYRVMTRNLLMAYVGLNMTNLLTSGHLAINNDAGHEMDIELGTTPEGLKRYVNVFGSGIDFAKVSLNFLSGLVRGNSNTMIQTIQNRLSPLITAGIHQASNVNYLGQPMYKANAGIGQQLIGRTLDAANTFLPPQLTNTLKYATGNQPLEPSIMAGLQAPVRYTGFPHTQAEQAQQELMMQGGATGQQINQALAQARNQTQANKQFNQQPSIFDSLFSMLGIPKNDPSKTLKSENTGDILLDSLNHQTNLNQEAATIKAIYQSGLTPDQINLALHKNGIDSGTAKEIMLKSLDTQSRSDVLQQMFSEIKNTQQYEMTVGELSRRGILTTGIVSNWLSSGVISEYQAKGLDTAIKLSKNQPISTGGYSTSGYGNYSRNSRYLYPQRPPAISIPYRPMSLSMSTQGMTTPKLKPFPKGIQAQQTPSYNNPLNAQMPNPNLDNPISVPKSQSFNLKIPKVSTMM